MEKQALMAAWAGSPEDALRFIRGEISLDYLLFSNPTAGMEQHGWARVGTVDAKIVELKSENLLVQEAIAALQAKKAKIYAEAEEAANGVEARIQRILAIEDKSGKAAPTVQVDENGNEVFVDDLPF